MAKINFLRIVWKLILLFYRNQKRLIACIMQQLAKLYWGFSSLCIITINLYSNSVKCISKLRNSLTSFYTKFKNHKFCIASLLLLSLVCFIAAGYLWPLSIPFEGNLLVDRVGFISMQESLFFDKIHTDELIIKGKQTYKFSGSRGDFSSNNEPRLKDFESLTIQLNDEASSLIIVSEPEQTGLQLTGLTLQQNSQVDPLIYIPEQSFRLKLIQSDNSKQPPDSFKPLKLAINNAQITCKGDCSIQELNFLNRSFFTFSQKEVGELQLSLPSITNFDIKLHKPDEEPFFGNIDVDKVQLFKQRENLDDESYSFKKSSILSGVIRIAGQNIDLKKEQFLVLGWKDPTVALREGLKDIQKLRYINVIYPSKSKELELSDEKIQLSEPITGLELGISGKTSRLAIGINPYLPVKIVQGNFFNRLPSDVMSFLNIVFAALFSSLLTWIFDNLPKRQHP